MIRKKHSLLFSLFILFSFLNSRAQNISGIINEYGAISAIDNSNCFTKLTIDSASLFAIGDSVLIIQMKGATIDSTNTVNFGNILNYGDAGNYEIASIQSIVNNDLILNESLIRSYNISGFVQVVKVPVYANVTITSTLSCRPWNGIKGGILSLIVTGTLTFTSDIDVSGMGFRGGVISNNPDGGCATANAGYVFDLNLPSNMWNSAGGAEKGESIFNANTTLLAGRGPLATGGGGGNKHNSGGGGGGNFTIGGKGGNEMVSCTQNGYGGIGGNSINYNSLANKLFLGGGGGSGDINNLVGSSGTNGGGIVILQAQNIVGNNQAIRSKGLDQLIQAYGIGDGAGGGGGGGTVLINQSNFTSPISIEIGGGHGGDQGPGPSYGCFGPGGGGGCGIVLSDNLLSPSINILNPAGTHGLILDVTLPCYGSPYGSVDGQSTVTKNINGFNIPRATPVTNTPIIVNLGMDTTFCAGNSIILNSGFPTYTKQWNNGDTSTSIIVSTSGQYIVNVSSISSCSIGNDTINVTVVNGQTFDIADQQLCEADTLQIQSPITNNVNWTWNTGETNSSIQIIQSGIYWLHIDDNLCTNFTDSFKVIQTLVPEIAPISDMKICVIDQPIYIQASFNNTVGNILWNDGSSNTVHKYTSTGTFWVSFSNTCGSDTSFFTIKDEGASTLFVPTAFSPNGDQVNDFLKIRTQSPEVLSEFYFAIYNRFGEKVFETDQINYSWNGEYKNKEAPLGNYYWYLNAKTNCGDIHLKGDITLLR